MYCHGELAQDRPATKYLTEFYLWMSLGGVLGGLFNALVAPLVFKTAAEYPLVLVLACLLMPATAANARNAVTFWLEIIGSTLVCGAAVGFLGWRLLGQMGLVGQGESGSASPQFFNLRALGFLLGLERWQLFAVLAVALLLGLVYILRRKEGA